MDNAPPPTNRLTIFHLLAWMAVTGVLFGLHVQDLSRERKDAATFSAQVPPELAAHFSRLLRAEQIRRAGFIPFQGAAVACVFLWPWRRWQFRGGFPTQPGHWVLLALGTAFLIDRICEMSFRLLLNALERTEVSYEWLAPSNLATIEALLGMILPVAAGAILVASLRSRFPSRLWTATIATLLAVMVLDCVGAWINRSQAGMALLMYLGNATPAAIWTCRAVYYAVLAGSLILASIATWRDRRQGIPRDLFHYTGLVVLTAATINRLAGAMLPWLLPF